MASQRAMGRIDYDLWDYDVVDTNEGQTYRVIDLAGNYHGSFHTEKAAAEAAWSNNRQVAVKQKRLYRSRGASEVYFVLADPNVRALVGVGNIEEGCVLINQGGQRIWVSNAWFADLMLVNN